MHDWKPRMQKVVRHLAEQLQGIRPGTLSPGFVETFRVTIAGNSVTLGHLASVIGSVDRILVRPFDPSNVGAIVKALGDSRLNAYAADPRTVAIGIPPISGEQKEELARHVKKLAEEAKIAVRMVRQDARKHIDLTGRGSLRAVQDATDVAVAEIDRLVQAKLTRLRS